MRNWPVLFPHSFLRLFLISLSARNQILDFAQFLILLFTFTTQMRVYEFDGGFFLKSRHAYLSNYVVNMECVHFLSFLQTHFINITRTSV